MASVAPVDSAMQSPDGEQPITTPAPMSREATADAIVTQLPPHRSHDPQYNMKRSDPFQFGSRYLQQDDDVFEFNAWDHVETDDAYKEYAEQQYSMQRESPVSDFDKYRFNSDPAKWWNLFYKNNTANFFKDRKWLHQEFPILDRATAEDAGPFTILEVGAGAGNTAFPILASNKNPKLKVHACDFSKKAVEVMRNHEAYNADFIQADVWDVAGVDLPPDLPESSVDVVIMVFIFSALSPTQWQEAVRNVYRVLKPGGEVCFRDYGRGDLAQVRFKKGRYLEENFYIRGDGTRVYFFEKDELAQIWSGPLTTPESEVKVDDEAINPVDAEIKRTLFDIEELGVDRRMLVNRARKLKMYRCWIQGRFRKR
ncbi:methyltransferase [Durotheca rogersii]|uniref:methyltransferase n=1 Tax=Durotheca rogersii TaxID=419775 RepID=UPI0022207E22|nr:methyltransferase [Durotheca rogersii]KAI5862813.1 methyltransferase [Durotheca rogersii]